jgi:hypothetical protein
MNGFETMGVINTSLQRGGMYIDNARTPYRFCLNGVKPLKRLPHITSLKRGVNKNGHSAAAGSFCAGCLAGTGRVAADRRDAFLRRKYAIRRLRFTRTLCCCPIESLSIENRRNAIGIQTDPAFFHETLARARLSPRERQKI